MTTERSRPVLIYGAGGFGRELVSWLRNDTVAGLEPVAFIDDAQAVVADESITGLPVGPLEEMAARYGQAGVILALGSGKSRQAAATRAASCGLKIETFIHSSVIVGERVKIGLGSLIMPGTVLTCDIDIGQLVVINCSCNVGHDVKIGDYATLLGNNSLNGNVQIGEFAVIGSRSTIHPGKTVGARSTVGIGSVVLRSVRDNATVFGVPAKAL